MQVIVCDACKKIIDDTNIKRMNNYWRSYELCEDCEIKLKQIKEKYKNDIEKNEQERKYIESCIKAEYENMGLKY